MVHRHASRGTDTTATTTMAINLPHAAPEEPARVRPGVHNQHWLSASRYGHLSKSDVRRWGCTARRVRDGACGSTGMSVTGKLKWAAIVVPAPMTNFEEGRIEPQSALLVVVLYPKRSASPPELPQDTAGLSMNTMPTTANTFAVASEAISTSVTSSYAHRQPSIHSAGGRGSGRRGNAATGVMPAWHKFIQRLNEGATVLNGGRHAIRGCDEGIGGKVCFDGRWNFCELIICDY